MPYHILKTGAPMFDMCHAYGVAKIYSAACEAPVRLQDEGLWYTVEGSQLNNRNTGLDVLDALLPIPSVREIYEASQRTQRASRAVETMDGLLATLFTTPGVRCVSVVDVTYKARHDPTAAERSLAKACTATKRWKSFAAQKVSNPAQWVAEVLQDYNDHQPKLPTPVEALKDGDLNLLLTIDPAWSYSNRRAINDGLLTCHSNVSIRSMPYAPLLALIGSVCFLRAHRVGGDMVNFYLPMAQSIRLDIETIKPILHSTPYGYDQCLVLQWLDAWLDMCRSGEGWAGISYQVLQTHKTHQSISISRGGLDNQWLTELASCTHRPLIQGWVNLLTMPQEEVPFETESLIDSLLRKSGKSWLMHLYNCAVFLHTHPDHIMYEYSIDDMWEVAKVMHDMDQLPLRSILERTQGTVRFGRALRQLGRHNRAQLTDIIDELDAVQTRDQLIRVLGHILRTCSLTRAKSDFVFVPSDDDVMDLFGDIDRFTPRTVAGVLIVISSARYPASKIQSKHQIHRRSLHHVTRLKRRRKMGHGRP